jgi:NADPH:quinone reductase-like Zn-dependent oxidoreductase
MGVAEGLLQTVKGGKAMIYNRYVATAKGGPEVLEWQEFEPGPPQHGEVAVKVEASGVLLADVLWQSGIAPVGPKHPFTPGYDVVGVIEEVGPGVIELERGQRVAAMIQYGGYTEYAILPAEKVVLVPEGIDPRSAAAATTSYLTAYMLIHSEGRLKAGDVLLAHGAGGGTGSAVVEVANLAGVKIYGTVSKVKFGLVEAKGGVPIDYKTQDFVEVLQAREPGGVDLVVDPIGGDVTTRSLSLLKSGGKLVSTAMIQSFQNRASRLAVPLGLLRLWFWDITHPGKKAYFWDVTDASSKDLVQYRESLTSVFDMLSKGQIKPEIGEVMSLEEAPKAQQMLLDFKVRGKVVLVSG